LPNKSSAKTDCWKQVQTKQQV